MSIFCHPLELRAAIILKYFRRNNLNKNNNINYSDDMEICLKLLKKTSRSFNHVILNLNNLIIKKSIIIFYLILRALDTIEDDSKLSINIKLNYLINFHNYLSNDKFINFNSDLLDNLSPDNNDIDCLFKFKSIFNEFKKLPLNIQLIIIDITKKMGYGMKKYSNLNYKINTINDYDDYCYYVAGLVGIGLTDIIKENNQILPLKNSFEFDKIIISMGLFLQKTNIIRDYYEDKLNNKQFWPLEITNKYSDLSNNKDCLNEMILNSLQHIPDVLTYLSLLKDDNTIFQFCSIPQIMAIATLAKLFNNNEVFIKKNIKINRSTTYYLILKSTTLFDVTKIFTYYIRFIKSNCNITDKNYLKINIQIGKIEQFIHDMYDENSNSTTRKLIINRDKFDEIIYGSLKEEESLWNVTCALIFLLLVIIMRLFF